MDRPDAWVRAVDQVHLVHDLLGEIAHGSQRTGLDDHARC
jgi:hypothetical protein